MGQGLPIEMQGNLGNHTGGLRHMFYKSRGSFFHRGNFHVRYSVIWLGGYLLLNIHAISAKFGINKRDMSTPCKNISDEILKVMTDFYTSDFIQDIIFVRKDCPPAIVLYKEQQVFDLIQFCSVEEAWELVTPAGIDKTYNISSAFLTAIVFPNRKLERDDQNVNSWPTWLGPLCLHWTSDKATFVKFFEKVKCDMGDYVPQGFTINAEKLMIGSDEEQAIVSALSHVFPGSIQLLCTHHISENLERHISHMDMSQREKGALHRKIMKLRHCKDLVEFKSEGQKIVEEVTNEHEREDAEYIEKVLEKMLKFSVEPRMQEGDIVPQDFTTNRSESFNSYVKVLLHHKPCKIPTLIKRLEEIVDMQQAEFRGTVHNSGNFRLTRQFAHLAVSDETWATYERRPELKDEAVQKVQNARLRVRGRPQTVISSDRSFAMPNVPNVATKKSQRKRPRSERSGKSHRNESRNRSKSSEDRRRPRSDTM